MINQQEIRNVRGYVVGASLLATLATLGGCAPEEVATDMRVQTVLTISTIKNDLEWKDTTPTGLPIVAQAGSILRDSDGTFYWYGTRANKIFTSGSPNTSAPPLGIGVYSSTNLVDWKDEGLIAAASSNAGTGKPDCGSCGRPSVIKIGSKYIMASKHAGARFFTAWSPIGPFTAKSYPIASIPNHADFGNCGSTPLNGPRKTIPEDMHLFEDGGVGYLAYTGSNSQDINGDTATGSKCNDPYAHIVQLLDVNADPVSIGVPLWNGWASSREAPAVFKRPQGCSGGSGSCYYLLTSRTNGWYSSETRYRMGSSLTGLSGGGFDTVSSDPDKTSWPLVGGQGASPNSFNTQHSGVTMIFGSDYSTAMYIGDRWRNKIVPAMGVPPTTADGLNGWYPLTFDGSGAPTMYNYKCWTIDPFGVASQVTGPGC